MNKLVKLSCEDIKSVQVMYNEVLRLYNFEMNSYNTLVNKGSGLIFINGTVITLVTLSLIDLIHYQLNPFPSLYFSICVSVIYILLFFSLLSAAISFRTSQIPLIIAENFYQNHYCEDHIKILDRASSIISEDTSTINKINFDKGKKIKWSIGFLSVSVGLYITIMLWVFSIHL